MVKTKTKQKFICPECDKELKNAKAVAGHLWFAHGKRAGEKASLYDNVKTLEREKGTNPDTIERIEKIENLVEKLVKAVSELTKIMREFSDVVLKLASKPANPGNPGNPGDSNPKEVKPDESEDNGLPDIFSPVLKILGLGKKENKPDDDKKKSEKPDDDDKSWFL